MSKVKRTILAISIAIVLALFVGYGIDTFYTNPEYNDFCDEKPVFINTFEQCTEAGGQWDEYVGPKPVDERSGWCNVQFECEAGFNQANEVYNKNVFIITLIVGILAVILGGVVLKLESVSSGIMSGGALTLIYGTIRYWGDMAKYLRFAVLGVVLAILIWIGYKKFKK
ncbi:hypothetical protein HOL21_03120 [Candidatus Woesearchaeota archaeon]|jgi:hypothetical protein|nr:hypothetical protein [Candidatus Woesearchaeota archaeon]MBT5397178.1 hypothetical protein [Candidatus Woesearchaeota archaeon]MBT5924833.1 hypothetical protein [Candidatus Woesearchaeota archaeon]MBT6367276.1 hypothetical protein [Candidatus Woesearchaeota archaeon]MBT7762578.1 hypothetical protein [Candidatus Woesearchaeota archaeon]